MKNLENNLPISILFRNKFQSMSLEDRRHFLSKLSVVELKSLYSNPDLFLFDKQIIQGDERYIILMCGRRFGKTVGGSAWLAKKILEGAKSVGMCGATHEDVAKLMVPALMSWFPYKLNYNQQHHKITGFKNGAVVHCFTSDRESRGFSLSYLWNDEICNWCDSVPEKVEERFKILDMAVSVGNNPQTIITSTPKPFPLFIKWQKKIAEGNPLYKLITGTMFDNPFLSPAYKQAQIDEVGSSRFGRQELYGELLTEVEGALWSQDMITNSHSISMDVYKNTIADKSIIRTIVAVDPSVSDGQGDECGILVASIDSNNTIYILADRSGQYTNDQWAQQTIKALNDFEASSIVIEKNNGGDLVKKNILSLDNNVHIKSVTATKGKIDRAQPVAALYERGKVKHIGIELASQDRRGTSLDKLEYELTHFTGNPKEKSPNRLDALCWAVHELRLTANTAYRDFTNIGCY